MCNFLNAIGRKHWKFDITLVITAVFLFSYLFLKYSLGTDISINVLQINESFSKNTVWNQKAFCALNTFRMTSVGLLHVNSALHIFFFGRTS